MRVGAMAVNNFKDALQFLLSLEGGYSNHPNDAGGSTNHGVTQQTYDAYRKAIKLECRSVKLIKNYEVEDIYKTLYWHSAKCQFLPRNLALVHFDWSVNHGVKGSIATLQKVVHATQDGIWGPNTAKAVKEALSKDSDKNLAGSYLAYRDLWYRNRAIEAPDQVVFLKGWLNRLEKLRKILT